MPREFERFRYVCETGARGSRSRLVDPDAWAKTGRTLQLTAKGNRQAFLQSLERIHEKGIQP